MGVVTSGLVYFDTTPCIVTRPIELMSKFTIHTLSRGRR